MKRHFKPQTYERRVVSSCLKKVNIYKRFLSTITPHEKDRDSLGCSLCHPWISCLVQVIQIQVNPIVFANRFICQCIAVFCYKLNVIYSCQRLTDFPLRTPIWQRFTKVSCLRSYHRERTGSRSIPEVKPCRTRIVLGWLTTKKYLVLQTFFFLFDYTIELFWLFQNTSFVLSRKRENQIVVTIGTLLHHIHVEF